MKRAERSIQKLSNRSKRASGTLGLMADRLKLIAGTGLVFGGVAAFGRWVVSIEQFNQAMRSSLAIMGDLTKAMQQDMTAAALQVASVTKFSATEAGQAYFFLASAGLSAAQSIAALPAVAQFAQAGMFDMSMATSLLTDALSALGRKVKDPIKNLENLVELSDILVTANTLADASVEQFAKALSSKAAAKMKVFNIEAEQGVAVLAAFAEQGLKAELGGRAFAIVVRDLTRAAVENQKAFDKWNIRVFDDLGSLRDLADILEDLEKAFSKSSTRGRAIARQELGLPSRSAEFLDALIGMSASVREFTDELREAGGKTEDVADNQLTEFAKGIAEAGATLAEFGRRAQPAIDWLGRLLQKLPDIPEALTFELTKDEQRINRARIESLEAQAALARALNRSESFEASGRAGRLGQARLGFDRFLPERFMEVRSLEELRTNVEATENALSNLIDEVAGFQRFVRTPTPKEIAEAEAAQAAFAEQTERLEKAWKKSQKSAEGFFKATRDPAEKLAATTEKLQGLLVGGAFDDFGGDETFFRAMDAATKRFEDAMKPLKPILPELPGEPRGGLRSLSELGGMEGAKAVSKAETIQDGQLKELRMIRRTLEQMQNTGRGLRR